MHPITHLLTSWVVANGPDFGRRDRALVTVAGVLPDFDGAGAIVELVTRNSDRPLLWWSEYHHLLGHNLTFGIAMTMAALFLAKRRIAAACLTFFVFHLHLLADIVGARGPDGYDWPVPYFFPFNREIELAWSGQWALNAWPNIALTILLMAVTFYLAWRRGFSPLELVSKKADDAFVAALRRRFGHRSRPEHGPV